MRTLILLATLLAAACANPTMEIEDAQRLIESIRAIFGIATPYIVGGTTAAANSYPWQVTLQYRGSHTCGGSIISDRYILTAAHCFTGMATASSWSVIVGKHSLSKTESTQASYAVSAIIKHESYGALTNKNDVALLKLSTAIKFTSAVQAIKLPSATIGALDGSIATVTGWGATREGGSGATLLQEVNVPIITNTKCQQKYPETTITNGMVCAGYDAGGKDSCQGDSGGPMVLKENGQWVQVGVVSWGYGCAQKDRPGVYTRVAEYLTWLKTKMV